MICSSRERKCFPKKIEFGFVLNSSLSRSLPTSITHSFFATKFDGSDRIIPQHLVSEPTFILSKKKRWQRSPPMEKLELLRRP